MVELKVLSGSTAVSLLAYERALTAVAFPHRAPNTLWDVPGVGAWSLSSGALDSKPSFLELLRQCIERTPDHLIRISIRHRMTEQGDHVLELVSRSLVDHELKKETLFRRGQSAPNMPWGM